MKVQTDLRAGSFIDDLANGIRTTTDSVTQFIQDASKQADVVGDKSSKFFSCVKGVFS